MKRFVLACMIIAASVLLAAPILAEREVEEVHGVVGQGVNRDAAINDALRQALYRVAGVYIMSIEEGRNFEMKKAEIFARTQGYIERYELVGDVSEAGGVYTAKVDAWVRTAPLRDALLAKEIIQWRKHRPRVIVIIPEYHIRRFVPDPAAETELIKQLTESDFNVVDAARSNMLKSSEKSRELVHGDVEKLVAAIGSSDAEIVIAGEAFSESANRENTEFGPKWTCGARVEVRAIEADTGRILYADAAQTTSWANGESVAGKRALTAAAALLCEGERDEKGFIEVLLDKLSKPVDFVQIAIRGLRSVADLERVEDALRDLRGQSGLHRYSYDSGVARINLETSLAAQDLAEEIRRLTFRGRLKVLAHTAHTIDLEFVSAKKGNEQKTRTVQ